MIDFAKYIMEKVVNQPNVIPRIIYADITIEEIQDIETEIVETFNHVWLKTDYVKHDAYLWIGIVINQDMINALEDNQIYEPVFIDALVDVINSAFNAETLNRSSLLN